MPAGGNSEQSSERHAAEEVDPGGGASGVAVSGATAQVKDDRKVIFGWCMYDWANSAYTMMVVGLMPIFFTSTVVGPNGHELFGRRVAADALWGGMIGSADLLAFLAAPVLGAIADFSAAKKRFLLWLAYAGSMFTILLFFSRSGDVGRTMALFVMAQFSFVAANVFYDAFLPQIASAKKMDWISGKGYSFGYAGGGIAFALTLALILGHEKVGITRELAARIGIAFSGLWWAAFTLITARYLREPGVPEALPAEYRGTPRVAALVMIGIKRIVVTLKKIARFRHLVLFLLAFMLYNDGIQTVINMATAYGTVELKLPASALMITLLIIQAIAVVGAMSFSRIAGRIGTKPAIMITLALWTGVVIYAYFMETQREFFVLGVVVGLVLGGSQALSRSFYGSMVPEQATAEFYGFYTVFTKFSSIWGPWVFALMRHFTGSSRLAILSIVFFFLAGMLLLYFVDEKKAQQAKLAQVF